MEPILVDTTVWIDWFKGADNPQTRLTTTYLSGNFPVWTAPVVIQETLQGIRDDQQFDLVRTSRLALNCFETNALEAAIEAAQLYRRIRKRGVTIRKANDCLIAQYALSADMILLHNDSDFDLIAGCSPLRAQQF